MYLPYSPATDLFQHLSISRGQKYNIIWAEADQELIGNAAQVSEAGARGKRGGEGQVVQQGGEQALQYEAHVSCVREGAQQPHHTRAFW